ncbi:MAG: Holliday junction branch migration protein RuvA [Candidatus Doudnabacteria bacterium]
MISFLLGEILQKTEQYIIVQNNGLGYKVFCTPQILEFNIGAKVELYIYHKVSTDSQALYGLEDFATLQFFELLLEVNGVGPKAALTIVSAAKIEVLQSAIINQDAAIFTRMSGVGKKTAERIILELKNKLGGGILSSMQSGGSDLYDALVALGYNPREIRDAITKIDGSLDVSEQIKQALKLISRT